MDQGVNGITFDNIVFKSTIKGLASGLQLIIQQGGTWSGKTFNAILAFMIFLKQFKEEACTLSIVGPTFPQLRRGAYKDFLSIKDRMPGYITASNPSSFTFKIDEHTIEFFSCSDNKSSAEKVRSGKRQYLLIDEANLIDWETADLLMGKSDRTSVITYNPYGRFWLHEMLLPYMDNDKYHFRITTFQDNKHLSSKTLEWLELKRISDPDSYRVLGEGKLGQGKGLIYTDVSYVSELPDCEYIYGLDYGYTNDPTALIKIGKHQGQLWGKQLIYETALKKDRLVRLMIRAGITENDLIVSERDFVMVDELKAEGFNIVKATKGPGSKLFGINRIKQYHLNIHRDSIDWQKEQLTYRYKIQDGKPTNDPMDGNDHCFDAALYACEQLLSAVEYNPKESERRASLIRR